MIYVVVGCHFKSAKVLCDTTVARLTVALEKARPRRGDRIFLLGDVPYEPGSPTLSKLMYDWLTGRGVPGKFVHVINGGVGTFSGAHLSCFFIRNCNLSFGSGNEFTVISSPWYFFQGAPIWKRHARKHGLKVSFISVEKTGGWRTWANYIVIGLIVRGAILVGIEDFLRSIATTSQCRRTKGFKWNGCR